MNKYLAVLIAVIVLLLSGCASLPSGMPPFLAMLTPSYPTMDGRCTGAVIGPHEVLTAAHCLRLVSRVVTADGQEARIVDTKISRTADVAIVITDRILWVDSYAKLANAQVGVRGELFGTCPYYMPHQVRYATYNGLADVPLSDLTTATLGEWFMLPTMGDVEGNACGGDSGGFILQNGKIVGVTDAVTTENFFAVIGSHVYTVPAKAAQELIDAQDKN